MEAIYPPNFPELGDFHAALAQALASFLEKRGQTLPRRMRDQAVRYGEFRFRLFRRSQPAEYVLLMSPSSSCAYILSIKGVEHRTRSAL